MSKKLMCFVLVMVVVGSASADRWYQEITDTLYQTPGNWQNSEPVSRSGQFGFTLNEKVNFQSDEGMMVVRGGIFADPRNVYQTASNTLILLDATLDFSEGWANIGRGRTTDPDHFAMWLIADGVFNGPTCTIECPLAWEPRDGTGEIDAMFGRLNLYGGVLTAQNVDVAGDAWGDGVMDIRGGVLRQTNDDTDQVQQDIDDGKIIAYSGYPGASLTVSYDALANQTVVKALSGLNPSPANQADGVDTATSALTWTTPADPNFVGLKKYVYFGENAGWPDYDDPNEHLAMQDRDYRATYIPRPNIPLVESDDTDNSTPISIVLDKDYWWIVDYGVDDVNVVFTYIFKFDTQNTAPVVDAGNNLYSFLDGGSRTITLDGSFIRDDNNPAPATPIWTVISALEPYEDVAPGDPLAAIDPNDYGFVGDDNNQLNSQFEVLTAGTYILELDADDGEFTAEFPQEVTLFIRDTACKATQIYPGYGNEWEPGTYNPMPGDVNEDCVVDLSDVADVSSTWLDDELISDTTEYIPE